MAERKIYIGSVGPFLYDDDISIDDPEGDFSGEDYCAVVTDGQLIVEADPTRPHHVARLSDVEGIGEGLYPVGIIVLTVGNTNPSTLGLPGTWEEY